MNQNNNFLNTLFIEAIKKGKSARLPVSGLSMYPTLREGDVLKIKPISYQEAEVGDILAYYNFENKKIIVHRLVKKVKSDKTVSIVTLSEAVPPVIYDPPINSDNSILAKVISLRREEREISLTTRQAQYYNKIRAWMLVKLPLIVKIHKVCVEMVEKPYLIPEKIRRIIKKIAKLILKN